MPAMCLIQVNIQIKMFVDFIVFSPKTGNAIVVSLVSAEAQASFNAW